LQQKKIGEGLTSTVWECGEYVAKKYSERYHVILDQEVRILRTLQTVPRIPRLKGFQKTPFPCIFMSPLGAPFSKFSLKSLRGLVETLRQVHNLGYVHRDIRQSNLVVYGEDVYLIDWGFAAPIGQCDFSGQVYYLTEELLLTEKFPLVTYTPKHDLEMLVKMLFSHLFEEKITSLKTQTNELEGVKKRKKNCRMVVLYSSPG